MRVDPSEVETLAELIMKITQWDWHRWSNDGNTDALEEEPTAKEVIKQIEKFLEKRGILIDYSYN